MGSIISAIHDDMEDYENLCKKYKEDPQYSRDAYGNSLLDCYGNHAKILQKRQIDEWKTSSKNE